MVIFLLYGSGVHQSIHCNKIVSRSYVGNKLDFKKTQEKEKKNKQNNPILKHIADFFFFVEEM